MIRSSWRQIVGMNGVSSHDDDDGGGYGVDGGGGGGCGGDDGSCGDSGCWNFMVMFVTRICYRIRDNVHTLIIGLCLTGSTHSMNVSDRQTNERNSVSTASHAVSHYAIYSAFDMQIDRQMTPTL